MLFKFVENVKKKKSPGLYKSGENLKREKSLKSANKAAGATKLAPGPSTKDANTMSGETATLADQVAMIDFCFVHIKCP